MFSVVSVCLQVVSASHDAVEPEPLPALSPSIQHFLWHREPHNTYEKLSTVHRADPGFSTEGGPTL